MTDDTAEAYSRFAHFLHRATFHPTQWSLTINSSAHERGIRATHDITITKPTTNTTPPSHQPVISIPASLLITPDRVRTSSFARSLLSASGLASLSAEQLLIVWLVYQRRQGEQSSAYPYLTLLPSYYSSLEWWTEAEVHLLPRSVDSAAVEEGESGREVAGQDDPVQYHRSLCTRIRAHWQQLNTLLSTHHPPLQSCQHEQPASSLSLPLSIGRHILPPSSHPLCPSTSHPLSCLISLAEYQWAYSTVSTRSCYWPTDGSSCLIPFLDMLNHSADVVCSCYYDSTTRLYSLYTQHKSTAAADSAAPLLHIRSGSEVYISYGTLSNWQLLVRYGFVLDDNVDEKEEMSVEWLESFIDRRCNSQDRRPPLQPQPRQSTETTARQLSNVRCCCGRSLLWQSLVDYHPSIAATTHLPHVPRLSSRHSRLLSLCGLYTPSAFSLTCCAAGWDVLTYIKCRTVALPSSAAVQPTTDTLQRWADTILNDEWVDEQHERRGRELLAAVLIDRMGRGGRQDGESSLQQQLDELTVWRVSSQPAASSDGEKKGSSSSGGLGSVDVDSADVSVLCRLLSGQFRVARRRMLLGALQHQLDAIQLARY